MAETSTLTLYPASYDEEDYAYDSVNTTYPLSNAIGNDSNATTYAQWYMTTGENAETYVYYQFDLSSLPSNVTDIEVDSLIIKAYINTISTSYIAARKVSLCIGKTEEVASTDISNTTSAITVSTGAHTFGNSGFSFDDIKSQGLYLKIYGKRGTTNTTTSRYMRFYGATLTLDCTLSTSPNTHIVTITATGNGTVTPSGAVEIENRGDIDITITANEGSYWYTQIYEGLPFATNDSPSTSPSSSTTLSSITFDQTFEVVFKDYDFFIKQSNGTWKGYASSVYKKDSNGWAVSSAGVSNFSTAKKYIINET